MNAESLLGVGADGARSTTAPFSPDTAVVRRVLDEHLVPQ